MQLNDYVYTFFKANGYQYSVNPLNPVHSDSNPMTIRLTSNYSVSRPGILMSYIIGQFFYLSVLFKKNGGVWQRPVYLI